MTLAAATLWFALLGAAPQMWRAGGHVVAADGHAYDYVVDFFRFGDGRSGIVPAQATVVDEADARVESDRRVERRADGRADARGGTVRVGDWHFAMLPAGGMPPRFELDLRVRGIVMHLHGFAKKPRIAYDFGRGPHLGYPSIRTEGGVDDGTRVRAVSGTTWVDAATGDAALAPANGVDTTFEVQLDDGREIVVEGTGPNARTAYPHALIVRQDGTVDRLSLKEYVFNGRNLWHSTHTHTDFPDQWFIYVPGQTQMLLCEPIRIDQESVSGGTGASSYEGAYDVFDVTPGSNGARLGSASGLMLGFGNPGAMK